MKRLISLGCAGLVAVIGLLIPDVSQAQPTSSSTDLLEAGRARFNIRCAGCHGQDGLGGERAPTIANGSRLGLDNVKALRDLIQHGIADKGMPAFSVPAAELDELAAFALSRMQPLAKTVLSGNAQAGAALFFGKAGCSQCHMIWGRGSINGPDLTEAARKLTLAQMETALMKPTVGAGGYQVATVGTVKGQVLRGFIRNESSTDLEMQSFDGRLQLLSKDALVRIEREPRSTMPAFTGTRDASRDLIKFLQHAPDEQPPPYGAEPKAVPGGIAWGAIVKPKPGEWPSYHGQLSGNRYSELAGITRGNVRDLSPRWMFSVPDQGGQPLEGTPVVVGGVMYVTRVNSVIALDARSGRMIWQYSRPASKGLVGDAAGGINRGVAVLGDRVFVATDNAHLLALHRVNGALLWDSEMADLRKHYGSTSAPLVVGDLVVAGVSGGDEGIRGQLNAYNARTGAHVWRFWSIPEKTDRAADGWTGRALEHGCGSTWLTGSYDDETQTLVWPIGNPCPDFNGDERKGDNLFTNSVVALDPKTGRLKWHYQFTPHDMHDWDATETPMLVDMTFRGTPRKLLLQGNRNGFFYVLDRTSGKFLAASPFVKKLTWAKNIAPDGRPVLAEAWQPTTEGIEICPSMDGASNWMSTAYHPGTGLFYLVALEKCNVFSKNAEWWKQGQSFYGGSARPAPAEIPHKYLRAIDPQTGKIAWEYQQTGAGETWGGLLATAGGLIFFCDDDGSFGALDARSGNRLWRFPLNARWHASPMTYAIDGRQYVAVAMNGSIIAFGLPQ